MAWCLLVIFSRLVGRKRPPTSLVASLLDQPVPWDLFLGGGVPAMRGGNLNCYPTVLELHIVGLQANYGRRAVPERGPSTFLLSVAPPIENLVSYLEPGLCRQNSVTTRPSQDSS